MALDPFFQQGMNAWTARNQAQSDRASKLNQLAQAGQMKDLLQRAGHQQKLAEADRTGEWGLADTALGKNLVTKRGATQFAPGTQASGNIANIQHAARIADNAAKMGGFPGFAQQIGQYLKNPTALFDESGGSPQFKSGTAGALLSAAAGNPNTAKAKDEIKQTFMGDVPSMLSERTRTLESQSKGKDPNKAADNVLATLDRLKGTKDEIKKSVRDPKTGKTGSIYKVGKQYIFRATDGTIRDVTGEL